MTLPEHHNNSNAPHDAVTTDPVITISTGAVRGKSTDNYDVYLGIPYAQAPVDKLRFRLPVPAKPWDGIFDAQLYGTPCPQVINKEFASFGEEVTELLQLPENMRHDDNWLTVNVWVPKNAKNAPVFVWIHGGAFLMGSNAEQIYSGDTFAAQGIVFVSINYRLGIEGFGLFPDAPHNRGIADQLCALQWVQENIAAFGGDPDNVTVGGQSAGSISVGLLLAATHGPNKTRPFHKAILQSGAPSVMSSHDAQKFLHDVAEELDVIPTAYEFSSVSPADILSAMSAVSEKHEYYGKILLTAPIIDGEIIPKNMHHILSQPLKIPLLVGYTAHEVALWIRVVKFFPTITWDSFFGLASFIISDPEIIRAYYSENYPHRSAEETFIDLMGDFAFVAPIRKLMYAQQNTTYAYQFSWQNPDNDFLAFHAIELPFVFNHLTSGLSSLLIGKNPPKELAQSMHDSWVNFIITGNPGWSTFATNHQLRNFTYYADSPGKENTQHLSKEPRAHLLDLW